LNGTVQGSNVVDLVNVLRKRKYFNPQGWETFGEALREANVPQDLIGHAVLLQMQSVLVGIPKIHLSVRSLSSF
jgi:hypothetical protein